MRHIPRIPLTEESKTLLAKYQQEADELSSNDAGINKLWGSKRKTKAFDSVKDKLAEMAGDARRCMYCEDSEGSDIEHFWPKSAYPGKMFQWENYLLGCGICNRNKGDRFPLDENGKPVLIDPTVDEPWDFLAYIPEVSQITARFDLEKNQPSFRGEETVRVLNLNREGIRRMYQKTYRRLIECLEHSLNGAKLDARIVAEQLLARDDHHLLGWCFLGTGQNVSPWKEFRELHPQVWEECRRLIVG